MHIPDGSLSPTTCAVGFAAVAPFWVVAARKAKRTLKAAAVPRLGVFAAFSFVVMMLNFPLPGGTSAHAVGGALMALVLGPWEAALGLSAAVILQALFFGDGGVTAIGANCLNMAVILPFVAYGVFHLARRLRLAAPKAAFLAGWLGLVASALAASLELGIQPVLFHDASGAPLYFFYSMRTVLLALVGSHLLLAGPVEGIVTSLVWSYLARTQPEMLKGRDAASARYRLRPAWAALFGLALVTPLGLLAKGTAFGEWGMEEVRSRLGYVPAGFAKMQASRLPGLLDGYGLPGLGPRAGYIVSALAGIALLGLLFWIPALLARRASRSKGVVKDHAGPA